RTKTGTVVTHSAGPPPSLTSLRDLSIPASLLSYGCAMDEQCSRRVPHSQCGSKGLCECQKNYLPYRLDKCLPPAKLEEYCLNDLQCKMANRFSYCKYIIPRVYGKCKCPSGYMLTHDQECMPYLENECHSNQDCSKVTPNSFCGRKGNASLCTCDHGFKMSRNKLRCHADKYGKLCAPGSVLEISHGVKRGSKFRARPAYLNVQLFRKHKITVTLSRSFFLTGISQELHDPDVLPKQNKNANDTKQKTNKNATSACFFYTCSLPISPSTVNPTKVNPHNEIPKLKPVSLGHSCNVTGECKLRDKQSACIDGVCECLNPTSWCSASHAGCLSDTFQCRNGQCISWYFVCDGMKNCADGSDETGCKKHSCPPMSFQCDDGTCKSKASVCNGKWECPDGSDEARCYKGIKCDRHAFQCKNGQCLPKYVFCNAVVDCIDGSDEEDAACVKGTSCPADSFRCKNNMCRSSAILCSGVDGCGDNSDETGCEVC
ncbi:unnamed protein product, partial [Ixodes pacificus]